jgi:uncharacterized protein (DUF433 family)
MPDLDDDRFGTEAALRAATESHGTHNPVIRAGMYVPTRGEVATADPAQLDEILDLWLWEGPTELIPTREQIEEVRSILLRRQDGELPSVRALVAMCDDYLDPATPSDPASFLARDPQVHSGDLVFLGTRVPVSTLTSILSAGGTVTEFLEGFPSVSRAQVNALLEMIPEAASRLLGDLDPPE